MIQICPPSQCKNPGSWQAAIKLENSLISILINRAHQKYRMPVHPHCLISRVSPSLVVIIPGDITLMTLGWLYLARKSFNYAKSFDKMHVYQRVRERIYESSRTCYVKEVSEGPKVPSMWKTNCFTLHSHNKNACKPFFSVSEAPYTTCVCCSEQSI